MGLGRGLDYGRKIFVGRIYVEYGDIRIPADSEKTQVEGCHDYVREAKSIHKGIFSKSGFFWFWQRHLDLVLHSSKELEIARARGMCKENLKTFYYNLQ